MAYVIFSKFGVVGWVDSMDKVNKVLASDSDNFFEYTYEVRPMSRVTFLAEIVRFN